ncbi:MAG: hypothetical protein H6R07_2464 [Proteobacteria bacterium]|nr:hypothetical protein [Pseudomonadota bacterium]
MLRDRWMPVMQWGAISTLLLLIVLCVGWELWWAPLRPGGSFLVLKALPLLLPLRGLLHGRRYTAQWTSLFILFWIAEGAMRAGSDQGLSQRLAIVELLLAGVCFVCVSVYARLTRAVAQ